MKIRTGIIAIIIRETSTIPDWSHTLSALLMRMRLFMKLDTVLPLF